MPENLLNFGVGAIVVVLVLEKFIVFAGLILRWRNGKTAGSLPPEFWQMEFRKVVDHGAAQQLAVLTKIQETLQEILINTSKGCPMAASMRAQRDSDR